MGIFSKTTIGVDIGTSSIKIIELEKRKNIDLTNYGVLGADYFHGKDIRIRERGSLSIDEDKIIQAISSVLKEAQIKTKQAYFSIPDFASFFTSFELPHMPESEIPEAVKYEAPRRIPLPISEVVLDWQLIKGGPSKEGKTPLRVLLVAVPNNVIEQYQRVAQGAGLKIQALEAEVFAVMRSLVKYQDKTGVVCLIDVGERSTTINIVSQGILKISHSFDISGEDFNRVLSEALKVDVKKAEIIKRMYGITSEHKSLQKVIKPLASAIVEKTKSIFDEIYLQDKERVGKIILSGGGAILPGFIDYFHTSLDVPVEIANPFLDINYHPTLETALKRLSPSFTIAVGMAQRGL